MTSKVDNAIAEMNAALTSMKKLNAATEKRLATLMASAHGPEAVRTLQRLGVDLPSSGFVEAAAVNRAIASMSVSRRFETKALLHRAGLLS